MTLKEFARDKINWLVLIMFYALLVFSPFLRGQQRVHDSILVEFFGYRFMTDDLFGIGFSLFYQGRPFSGWFYLFLDFLNLPFNIAMGVSVFFSLVFLALSAFIVFFMLHKYTRLAEKGLFLQIIALLGCVSLFFNIFILDSFLFYENAIMSLGVLFGVLAVLNFVKFTKKGYIWAVVFLILGIFSYQASIAYFIPLVVLFIACRVSFCPKKTLKFTVLAGAFYAFAMFLNFLYLLLLVPADARFGDFATIDFIANARGIIRQSISIFSNLLGFLPRFSFFVMLLGLFALATKSIFDGKWASKLFVLGLAAVGFVFAAMIFHLPIGVFYVLPRSAVSLAGFGGLILIFFSIVAKNAKKWAVLGAAVFVLIISASIIDAQMNNFANNRLEQVEVAMLAQQIWQYEQKSNQQIEYLHTIMGIPNNHFRPNLRHYQDVTIRLLSLNWMVRPLLENHMNRSWQPDWSVSYADFMAMSERENEIRLGENRLLFVENRLYLVIY